jgi:hypothetical protein
MVTRAKKIADLEFTNAEISGGTIDGTSIGATTPSSGAFTGVSTSDGITITKDSGTPLEVNRTTDTGDFATFSEGGTEKGVLAGYTDGFVVGSGTVGIMFDTANNCIRPIQTDGTANDGGLDVGFTGHKFKDLTLSGIVYSNDLFCDNKGKIGNVTNNADKSLIIGDQGTNDGYASLVVGMVHDNNGDLNLVSGYENTVHLPTSLVSGALHTVGLPVSGGGGGGGCAVFGNEHTLQGVSNSLCSGRKNEITGSQATALGNEVKASADNSLAGGSKWGTVNTETLGWNSIAYGAGCVTHYNANNSAVFGTFTQTGNPAPDANESANQSMAMGYQSIAYADNSFAGGNTSYAFGDTSFAFGNGSNASKGFSNVALGRGITTPASATTANLPGAVAVGQWNEWAVTTDQHFAVGTGTSDGQRYTSFYVGPRTSGNANIVMRALKDSSRVNSDYAAAQNGVPLGGLYINISGYVRVRIT